MPLIVDTIEDSFVLPGYPEVQGRTDEERTISLACIRTIEKIFAAGPASQAAAADLFRAFLCHPDEHVKIAAVRSSRRLMTHGTDIATLLPLIEILLDDPNAGVRRAAAYTIGLYGIMAYGMDIVSGWPKLAEIIRNSESETSPRQPSPSDFSDNETRRDTSLTYPPEAAYDKGPKSEDSCIEPVWGEMNLGPPLLLSYQPFETSLSDDLNPATDPVHPLIFSRIRGAAPYADMPFFADILQSIRLSDRRPDDILPLSLPLFTDCCVSTDRVYAFPDYFRIVGKLLFVILFVLFTVDTTFTQVRHDIRPGPPHKGLPETHMGSEGEFQSLHHATVTDMASPFDEGLSGAPLQQHLSSENILRLTEAETGIMRTLLKFHALDADFVGWLNRQSLRRLRGFLLFARSSALSDTFSSVRSFGPDHWTVAASTDLLDVPSVRFLEDADIMKIAGRYERDSAEADMRTSVFLGMNKWLFPFLGSHFDDFRTGLFYFFLEHDIDRAGLFDLSRRFSEKERSAWNVSGAIIRSKDDNLRISPKRDVPEDQIREIVAASFFVSEFYSNPADLMALISAYESNFTTAVGINGFGTTQQTTKSANAVLHSNYWASKLRQAAGVGFRRQIVTIHTLTENLFLNISEAAKTMAVKSAELGIATREISCNRKVMLGGREVPAIWALAYKYNGSLGAGKYATEIEHYYRSRTSWIAEFDRSGSRYATAGSIGSIRKQIDVWPGPSATLAEKDDPGRLYAGFLPAPR